MQLKKSTRTQSRIRLGIQGPSGSGKTYGALQVAYGICGDWTKIGVVDTEYGSANLYSHLGEYNVLNLSAPFSPERFIDSIHICEAAGMEVIIIDSASFEWDGEGGILDIHNSMTGNSFTNWGKVSPRHCAFIRSILQSPCHVIISLRSKQDYVLTDKNGKMVPEKVGLKAVQRDGIEYELTALFEVDIKHNVIATKDRTSLFAGKPEFKLTVPVGQRIQDWCTQGERMDPKADLVKKIENTQTVEGLLQLYKDSPAFQSALHDAFSKRRKQLEADLSHTNSFHYQNQQTNGQPDANQR